MSRFNEWLIEKDDSYINSLPIKYQQDIYEDEGADMLVYPEIWGDDIDGNRGMVVWNYELEDNDFYEVQEKVYEYIWENGYSLEEIPKVIPIEVYDYINEEEVVIEIETIDYLDKE